MFHPTTFLLLWCLIVTLTQRIEGGLVFAVAAACSLAGLVHARPRMLTLMRRARYLMLAIVLVFAWATPGYLLFPAMAWASPTSEGLAFAFTHAM